MKEIDLVSLGFLSSSTKALLRHDKNVTDLIGNNHPFINLENAIAGKANFSKEKRQDLVNVLKANYERLGLQHPSVNANIEAITQDNTYTVTTGQQLHLFLGPAFMVYKLISTIKAAEHYKTLFPDKNFIPVFWLASEDHDFDEIKNTPLFGANYPWITDQKGACGRYHLKDIDSVFEPLKAKLINDSKAQELLNSLEEIYKSSNNLSDATIRLTHQLLAEHGLLCLDADHPVLKAHFESIIKEELINNKSEKAFNQFSDKMTDSQLSLQLKSRPINLFYLKDGLRARIERKNESFVIVDTSIEFTEKEILEELNKHPENFSPNAVLRPLYQETILPNIAYIGGNAEMNYWLQLKEIFELYQTIAPFLVLRQSAWMIGKKQSEWLESKNIDFYQLLNLKNEKDRLSAISQVSSNNKLEEQLDNFNQLRANIQQYADSNKLPNIKSIIESGKVYEKAIKDLIKSELNLNIEKNDRDLKKLEQLQNDGFSLNNIQERTNYVLSFWIKDANYLTNCFSKLYYKPGCGFFLNI